MRSDQLRASLRKLPPTSRDLLRRALVVDGAGRDVIASTLLRYRDDSGYDLADLIDMLTLYPHTRRLVIRMLAEIDAAEA